MKRNALHVALMALAAIVGTTVFTASAFAQGEVLYVVNHRVGIGTSSPSRELHVLGTANEPTWILSENLGSGTGAAGVLRAAADISNVNFQAHGSGRTIARFGRPLAGWAEFLQVNGKGLIVGTFTAKPLVLGTNNTTVLELTADGRVLHKGTEVHADYVFEAGYRLESIDEHSEYMWSNGYLPAIGEARQDVDGRDVIDLGQDRRGIVEELEKAHIYIDQLHDRLSESEKQVLELTQRESELSARLAKLEEALATRQN